MIEVRNLSLKDQITQGEGNIVSDMDGETVMMNIHNGSYYNLGRIGGRIWELITTPISAQELVEVLMTEYEVSRQECEEHVLGFLTRLGEEKLIRVGETA